MQPCRPAALQLIIGIALIAGAGCAEKIKHGKPEYLSHLKPPAVDGAGPRGGAELFPGAIGSHWTYQTTRKGDSETRQMGQERVVAARYVRVGNVMGIAWERQRVGGQRVGGVRLSREVYARSKQGVSQLIQGSQRTDVVLDPPLPILRYPAIVRRTHFWKGKLRQKRGTLPAEAAIRVSRFETVSTPAGSFKAFRVDTALTVIQNNVPVLAPSSAWYAPGVGIVKLQYQDQGFLIVKTLAGFRLK